MNLLYPFSCGLRVLLPVFFISSCATNDSQSAPEGCHTPVISSVKGKVLYKFQLTDDGPARYLLSLVTQSDEENAGVLLIDVHDIATRCQIQSIDSSMSELLKADGAQLEVIDMNFDGFNDFRFPLYLTAGPNTPYSHWLYNKDKNKFYNSGALDRLAYSTFDGSRREVIGSWRDGQSYGANVYIYQEQELLLKRKIVERWNAEGLCTKVEENYATGETSVLQCD